MKKEEIDRHGMYNYNTSLSAKGTIEIKFKDASCFAAYFSKSKDRNDEFYEELSVTINTPEKHKELKRNSMCIFDMEQVNEIISDLQQLIPFEYNITDNELGFDVNIKITSNRAIQKVLLTYIRYLYESPYCYMMYDALRLRKELDAYHVTLLQMLSIVECVSSRYLYPREGHSLFQYSNHKNDIICNFTPQSIFDKSKQVIKDDNCYSEVQSTLESNSKHISITVPKLDQNWIGNYKQLIDTDKYNIRKKYYLKIFNSLYNE